MPPTHDPATFSPSGHGRGGHLTRWLTVLRLTLAASLLLALVGAGGCHKVLGEFEVTEAGLCAKGQIRCNKEYLLSCNQAQDGWNLQDTCATEERCNPSIGACRICQPGDVRCNLSAREVCSADGSEWEFAEDCQVAEMCNPTGCFQCPNPGEVACQGSGGNEQNRLVMCVAEVGWVEQDICETEQLCTRTKDNAASDPGSFTGSCMPPICDAGELRCVDNPTGSGAVLQRCAQGRQMWTMVDTCDTQEVCELVREGVDTAEAAANLTECRAPCGPAGSFRCVGQSVMRCADDQTEEIETEVCAEGRSCDPVSGTCQGPCTPGDYRCNASLLESCNANEEWVLEEDCLTRALCSVTSDDANGTTTGECVPPACDAGETRCSGAKLERCNADRTDWLHAEDCVYEALCNALSARCDPHECVPQERRCNPGNPQLLELCGNDLQSWTTVEECAPGTTCNSDPRLGPNCLGSCPETPYRCLGNVRQVCDDQSGTPIWTEDRTCNTAALCQCALDGSCLNPTSDQKCGQPVCGENLPDFNCDGGQLQSCSAGRDQWLNQSDCGDAALCDTGLDGDNGACLLCPVAGAVECFNSGASRRTCSADRQEWIDQQSCAYGCVDNGTNDYCAVCFAGETRCDSGADLDVCGSGRRTLVDQENCSFSCINSGLSDYCAPCAMGERRCNGATILEECSSNQTQLQHLEDCQFTCIDRGLNDFCGTCNEGDQQCSGNTLQVCSNGVFGGGMACMYACLTDDMGDDECAPDCTPGVQECVSSNSAVRVCGDDGTWNADESCNVTCINSGTLDFCAPECAPGQTECATNSSVRVCDDATGTWVSQTNACSAPTPACLNGGCVACRPGNYTNTCANATTLRTCSSSGSLSENTCPTDKPVCTTISGEGRCTACTPGARECNNDTLRVCDSSGNWVTTDCAMSGQVCDVIGMVAQCVDCLPDDTMCDGQKTYFSCTASGTWSTSSMACPNNADCSNDQCEECEDGARKCSGTSGNISECVNGAWGSATACPDTCVPLASFPHAQCSECTGSQTKCTDMSNVGQLQTCSGGLYGSPNPCPDNNSCQSATQCGECSNSDTNCADTTTLETCSNGTWTSMSCMSPNPVCATVSGNDGCHACDPTSADSCTNDGSGVGQLQSCGSDGTLSTAACSDNHSCSGNACGECSNGDTNCADATTLQTCNNGSWSSTSCGSGETCSSGACSPSGTGGTNGMGGSSGAPGTGGSGS